MDKSRLKTQYITQIQFLFCIIALITFLSVPFKHALALGNETDRLALLALKDRLVDGSPVGALASWNASLHFCEWHGVRCGAQQQRVVSLRLTGMKLGGSISPSIGNLSFLTEANLSDNGLQGNIPREFGQLRLLRFLNLSYNNLQGNIPMELTNCSNLQLIYLNYNSLSGEILFGLGDNDMKNLTTLSLAHNNLIGSIPSSLGNLSSLDFLQLTGNNLEGIIPHSLGRLSKLKTLAIGQNNLSGTIPSSIYNLSSLTFIQISTNKLSGGLAPEFAFPKLEFLHIGGNQFSGSIPRSVTNISSLKQFDIHSNGFSGSVPPDMGNFKNLDMLSLNYNNLGTGKAGDLDFLSSLTNCSLLKTLVIHVNRFGGVLPDSVANLSTQLEYLYLAGNLISGSIPDGIGNLVNLTHISTTNVDSQQATSSIIRGTIGYLAPEYGMGAPTSPEGDVYSYGILLLEMITGKRPTDDLFHDGLSLHNFCKMALPEQLEEIIDFGLFEHIDEKIINGETEQNIEGEMWECLVSFTKVGVACSVEVPTERMKIQDAITELVAIKARLHQGTKLIHTPQKEIKDISLFSDVEA
ncbi:hypothetical protein PTKIN_Ptkin16aG0119300 [Pterospermum kingtungense]